MQAENLIPEKNIGPHKYSVVAALYALLAQIVLVFLLGYLLSLGPYGVWGENAFGFAAQAFSLFIFPLIGFFGVQFSIKLFQKRAFILVAYIVIISSMAFLLWYPAFLISKRIAGIFNYEWTNRYQQEKAQNQQRMIDEFQRITDRGNVFIAKEKEIAEAHFDYYQKVFQKPQTIVGISSGNRLNTKDGLTLFVFDSTQSTEKKQNDNANKHLGFNQLLNKEVDVKLLSLEFFEQRYVESINAVLNNNYLVDKILTNPDYSLEDLKSTTNPIWKDIQIPALIYYQGNLITSELQ